MESLNCIDIEIRKHIQEIESINNKFGGSKGSFFKEINNENKRFANALRALSSKYPFFIQLDNISEEIISNGVDKFIQQVGEDAKSRITIPTLPLPITNELTYNIIEEPGNLIQKDSFEIPYYVTINYYNYLEIDQDYLEAFLITILLSMPVGSVKLTFLNLGNAAVANNIINNIDSKYYGKEFIQVNDLHSFIDTLEKIRFDIVKDYGDLVSATNKSGKLIKPYEIIILLGNGSIDESINTFLKNDPSSAGIHFINVVKEDSDVQKKSYTYVSHIFQNEKILDAAYKYLNKEIENATKAKVVSQDVSRWKESDYETIEKEISISVGMSGIKEVAFTMDIVSHAHAFIIGQSGSGKSVFLHNIIGSSMLKYAPEDLQLYLLDFKIGGVEFNRYKGSKHIKALLVDNSDQQVTLEILRELKDRMTERGKLLRSAGVDNILDYNKIGDNRMPHILVIADECHEMFQNNDSFSHSVSNEISEIIKKIAKEGRSQGVHLILATQTLSGTEISNEILNNITDHYLLKCAPADSERMVEHSSDITSKLVTGQIYYHHSENQVQFQAFGPDKEKDSQLMDIVNTKALNHKSNGGYYFNGAAHFDLRNENYSENTKISRMPVAYVGRSIDLSQKTVSIPLSKEDGENILIFGLNDESQVSRTTFNTLISMLATQKAGGRNTEYYVIDCSNDEDNIYTNQLSILSQKGHINLVDRDNRATILKALVQNIKDKKDKDIVLFVFGQEKFRELKMDLDLEENPTPTNDLMDDFFGSNSNNKEIKTFKQAMEYILNEGPRYGIHTILQVDKPNNFMFEDYLSAKNVLLKFKHLIMLRSDEMAASSLHLKDDIHLEKLSSFSDRLRAYYYAGDSDKYTLFTPYISNQTDEIEEFLKN